MQFAILVYERPEDIALKNKASADYRGAYMAYAQALRDAGVATGGAGLQAATTATRLRVEGGKRQVQDGPFADTKEELGGFFLIDVPDLDKALEWAARCPGAARAGVEVRPCLVIPQT
jgi:hypothetical protein